MKKVNVIGKTNARYDLEIIKQNDASILHFCDLFVTFLLYDTFFVYSDYMLY